MPFFSKFKKCIVALILLMFGFILDPITYALCKYPITYALCPMFFILFAFSKRYV